jgi:DNA/RNA endonuclease YhcR with UshA esterase domain
MAMKKALLLAAMSVALVVASRPAFAHHAGGNYDTEHPVTLTGTVTEYRLVSPHTQIFFDVKDEQGNVTSWVALSGPPQRLYRAGWKADTLKPGDQVTVTGSPSKDGKKFMGVKKIIGPSGQPLAAEGE